MIVGKIDLSYFTYIRIRFKDEERERDGTDEDKNTKLKINSMGERTRKSFRLLLAD